MFPFDASTIALIKACRDHADDLFRAALLLKGQGAQNLAYHMGTLALEELGKAELIGMRACSKGDDRESWYRNQLDDHVKKLFWALWAPLIFRKPDREEIESLRGLASRIHENRLRGLYVSAAETEQVIPPKSSITEDMLNPLLTLVESSLAMKPALQANHDEAALGLLRWFSQATEDPQNRQFVFSGSSFDQMEKLSPIQWISWLKSEIEAAEERTRIAAERELKRQEPGESEASRDKWRLRLRLYSFSHSIRSRDLNTWNEKCSWLKMLLGDKKASEMIVDLTLPMSVPIQALWIAGFGYSNSLLAALNIASCGLFWWQKPGPASKFYEKITDLENNLALEVRRAPELRVGWPNAVMDAEVINRTVLAFGMMPRPDETAKHEPFSHYLTGVANFARTDIFLQYEGWAYGAFLECLRSAVRIYRLDTEIDLSKVVKCILGKLAQAEIFQRHVQLADRYATRTLRSGDITLKEVAEIKLVCDLLFNRIFYDAAASQTGVTPRDERPLASNSEGK